MEIEGGWKTAPGKPVKPLNLVKSIFSLWAYPVSVLIIVDNWILVPRISNIFRTDRFPVPDMVIMKSSPKDTRGQADLISPIMKFILFLQLEHLFLIDKKTRKLVRIIISEIRIKRL